MVEKCTLVHTQTPEHSTPKSRTHGRIRKAEFRVLRHLSRWKVFTAGSSGEGMLGMLLITELLHMWRSQNVETDGSVCAVRLS